MEGDVETYKRLLPYLNETYLVQLETAVVADWIFAIKYFEVALKLPLLVHPDDPSIQAKRAKIKWAIWTLNIVFYASLLTYSILL